MRLKKIGKIWTRHIIICDPLRGFFNWSDILNSKNCERRLWELTFKIKEYNQADRCCLFLYGENPIQACYIFRAFVLKIIENVLRKSKFFFRPVWDKELLLRCIVFSIYERLHYFAMHHKLLPASNNIASKVSN